MAKRLSKWEGAVCCICGEPFKCAFEGKPYSTKPRVDVQIFEY